MTVAIPETPTVNVRFSTELLRQLSESEGPVRLESLGGPDDEGFYEPVFSVVGTPCSCDCSCRR